MKPKFQERLQIYVMGPNQDSRLASILPGQSVPKINLQMDLDAPFVLRSRAIGPVQTGLVALKTQWTDSEQQYRQSTPLLESLQQPYYGQMGNPKPVSPEIVYPAGGTLTLDLINAGVDTLTNVVFYWIGVNLYPWGTLPAPTYPAEFRATTFAQPFVAQALGTPEIRLNQPFKAKSDGDLVIRAGQAGQVGSFGGADGGFVTGTLTFTSAMSVVLKDYNGMPYSNDWVDINVMFGMGGQAFGTGPGLPGLIYPEIYLPMNRNLFIDVQQSAAGAVGVDLMINFIGAKIFRGSR
jgi:hypothetical protein